MVRARVLGAVLALGVGTAPAMAEIKDYQIARMLNLRTDCQLHALKRVEPKPGEAERFIGECGNATFYPDGIEVACPEPDDEWSCRVETEKKSFPKLDLLRRPQ